ncbi:hypothetical protein KAS45_02635 [candidate division WOR-3 bacterium]|nr:hypothetical protein [candidate division WOR-3 bacterium]
MKKIVPVVIVLVVVILIWQLYPTETKKLKRDILILKKAVEKENTERVMELIDLLYIDMSGMVYSELVGSISQFFAQVDSIRVQMSGMRLSIDSTDKDNTIFASCSLGLRVVARYEGERILAFGGIIKPSPVKAYFRKSDQYYKVYKAEY